MAARELSGMAAQAQAGAVEETRLSDVISALSYALDLVEGQPAGHSVRSCLIGMRLAAEVGLGQQDRSALFYALLLKDSGCSSNAARVSTLFRADDLAVKRDFKITNSSKPLEAVRHVARMALPGGGPVRRAAQVAKIALGSGEVAKELVAIRCERGADIALMIGCATDTSRAIRSLDEHWDGGGHPEGLTGESIPLLARLMGLAQTVEVYFGEYGEDAAYEMAHKRSGEWFDPALVRALESIRRDRRFWESLGEQVPGRLAGFEPGERIQMADTRTLDRVAEAFAKVVDAKSPFTYRHSEGVAEIAVGIGRVLGLDAQELADLRRAGLLHDIGKLGVSNLILDKPGALDDAEWALMRQHPRHTLMVLERIPGFGEIAEVAASHHERLDGRGYHRGLTGDQLSRPARILAVADVCEALSADRPYRAALSFENVRDIMSRDVGVGLCPEAYGALETYLEAPSHVPVPFRAPSARPPAGRSGGREPARSEVAAAQVSEAESAGVPSTSRA